jgi:predicted RNA-binding protein Jag
MTVEKRTAVGETVIEALEKISNDLNIPVGELDFAVDSEQFISDKGHRIGLREFEISGWKKVVKEGVQEMRNWLLRTFEVLDIVATVSVRENNGVLHCYIESEQGGQIIGRRGSTLRSIEKLMIEASTKSGYDWTFSLHVEGGEDKRERRDRRDNRDNRNDRNRRDRSDRGNRDDEGLKRLAKKLASKVLGSSEALIIEKDLNGYQRRIVHMVIKDFSGVDSESFDAEGVRKIRLVPSSAASNED